MALYSKNAKKNLLFSRVLYSKNTGVFRTLYVLGRGAASDAFKTSRSQVDANFIFHVFFFALMPN